MNQATTTLIGNLKEKPELRTNAAGNQYATASLAVNVDTRKKTPAGKAIYRADWYNIIVNGPSAVSFVENGSKGRRICVTGDLELRPYTSKVFRDENGRFATMISADLNVRGNHNWLDPKPVGVVEDEGHGDHEAIGTPVIPETVHAGALPN